MSLLGSMPAPVAGSAFWPGFLPAPLGGDGFALPKAEAWQQIAVRGSGDAAQLQGLGIELHCDPAFSTGEEPALIVHAAPGMQRRLRVRLGPNARGNHLVLDTPSGLNGEYFFAGQNNWVVDCGTAHASRISASFRGRDGVLFWGAGATTNGVFTELRRDGDAVVVGADCMMASHVVLRPTDMHAVFRLSDGEILNNLPGLRHPIILHPHCWVGQDVIVLKDVTIGPGCILGAGAVVTASLPPACAAAGNPARILREDVSWTRTSDPTPRAVLEARAAVLRAIAVYEAGQIAAARGSASMAGGISPASNKTR